MAALEGLAALSEGYCPLGHGPLTCRNRVNGGFCDSCTVWWWSDSRQIDITIVTDTGTVGFSLSTGALQVMEPAVILERAAAAVRSAQQTMLHGPDGDAPAPG